MDVAIIDYKMSNLHSVQAACNRVGLSSVITSDKNQILDSQVAILPGVGSFGEAMSHIRKLKLDEYIYEYINTGKLFIGICLGLQLLFNRSEEFGNHKGLGIIDGEVKKFDFFNENGLKYPVPQISWNQIFKGNQNWEGSLLGGISDNTFMYFVHSLYVVPNDKNIILSKTIYGNIKYCSSIQYKNIFACQFHPEKSGEDGIRLYKEIKKNIKKGS
jgi:imidazole glycerol-phosphate synthase subunit HisH